MLPLLNPVTRQMSDSSVVWKVKYLAAVQSLCHWEFWAVPVEDVTIYNAQCHHAPPCRIAVWKHHVGHQTSHSATHSSLSVMHQSTSLPPSPSSPISPRNCSESDPYFTVHSVLMIRSTKHSWVRQESSGLQKRRKSQQIKNWFKLYLW